jgi:hypothetical protein
MGPPKSDAGKRDVPLVPMVVNTLREWKLACPKGDLGLVFSDRKRNGLVFAKPLSQPKPGSEKTHWQDLWAAGIPARRRVAVYPRGILSEAGPSVDGPLLDPDDVRHLRSSVPGSGRTGRISALAGATRWLTATYMANFATWP